MPLTHRYSFIKDAEKYLRLVVSMPAIKSEVSDMQNSLIENRSYPDTRYVGGGDKQPWLDLPCAGIIRHLKEEFGDYNDAMIYKWNQLETAE